MTSKPAAKPSGSGWAQKRPKAAKKRAKPAVDKKERQRARIERMARMDEDFAVKVIIAVLQDEIRAIKRALWRTGLPEGYYDADEEE